MTIINKDIYEKLIEPMGIKIGQRFNMMTHIAEVVGKLLIGRNRC